MSITGKVVRTVGRAEFFLEASGPTCSRFEDALTIVVAQGRIHRLNEFVQQYRRPGGITSAEIIATLYRRHGVEAVTRLSGDCAYAVADKRVGCLLLVRDPLGLQPMYWGQQGNVFAFGTRIEPVANETESLSIDGQALCAYLLYAVVPHPFCIFSGIQKLPPGTLCSVREGMVSTESYWDLSYAEEGPHDKGQMQRELYAQLEQAVQRQLSLFEEETSKFGCYLSGGTDSSAVAGMLTRLTGAATKTFSIGFEEQSYNELGYARLAARHFGAEHHEFMAGHQDLLEAVEPIAEHYEEPFGNSSAVASYCCARMAHENGVRYMFAGDGGDELFGGNSRYIKEQAFSLYPLVPEKLRRFVIEPLVAHVPARERVKLFSRAFSYVQRARLPHPQRLFSHALLFLMDPAEIFHPDFLSSLPIYDPLQAAKRHYHKSNAPSELNRLLYVDMKITIADNDVPKVTGTAGMAGVEVRFPLLDQRLAEFAGRIPARWKVRRGQLRYLYKEALKNFLPAEILCKKKHGFGIPFDHWLRNRPSVREYVLDVLLSRAARERGYFHPGFVPRLLELHRQDTTPFYADFIWRLLMLEQWHRKHIDVARGTAPARPSQLRLTTTSLRAAG